MAPENPLARCVWLVFQPPRLFLPSFQHSREWFAMRDDVRIQVGQQEGLKQRAVMWLRISWFDNFQCRSHVPFFSGGVEKCAQGTDRIAVLAYDLRHVGWTSRQENADG